MESKPSFQNDNYTSMLSSPTRRPKLKDLEMKVLKYQDTLYNTLEKLKSQKKKQKGGRRVGNSILTHMEDSEDSSDGDLDIDELQILMRTKLIDLKGCFDKIQDTVNENSKIHMVLIKIIKDDYINQNKLCQIFNNFNENYQQTVSINEEEQNDKQNQDLDYECSQFKQGLKQILKEQQDYKVFITKYEQDKRNMNLRINDRVKQSDFSGGLNNLEERVNKMINERLANFESWLQEAKKVTTEKVQALEDRQSNLEKNIQWRITDCEQLLKSRVNEKYVQDYGQIIQENVLKKLSENDSDTMLRLSKVQQDFSTKFENQDVALEEKLQLFKKMQFDLDKKINLKADKTQIQKIFHDAKESKIAFDQQFEMMQKGYQSFDLRNKDNQLKIVRYDLHMSYFQQLLFQYQEERDQAIKNIPKNVEIILEDLEQKLADCNSHLNLLQTQLSHKVETDQHIFDLSTKLDNEQFYKWFPKDMLPADYFQSYIKKESLLIQQNILDMAKMWDSKMVKLRQDMNIHNIIKKIGEKAESTDVKEAFDGQSKRIDQIEENFVQIINEVETLNLNNQVQVMKIQEIHQRQQEVLIGKRNINCLSCAQDPPEASAQGVDGKMYRNASQSDTNNKQNLFDIQIQLKKLNLPGMSSKVKTSRLIKNASNLQNYRYNKSHQISRQDSPDSVSKMQFLNDKIVSAYTSQQNTQAMTSQNRNLDDFNTRTNSHRHLRSISSVVNDNTPMEQRLNAVTSYIDQTQNVTFVYESGQQFDRIRDIIKGTKSKKIERLNSSGIKNKKKHPFALLALNEMKERQNFSLYKQVDAQNYNNRPESAII